MLHHYRHKTTLKTAKQTIAVLEEKLVKPSLEKLVPWKRSKFSGMVSHLRCTMNEICIENSTCMYVA